MDTYHQLVKSEIHLIAAALAYSSLLSLIPFLALTLAIFQMIGGLEFLYPKVQFLFLDYFKTTAGTEASLVAKKIFDRIQAKTLGTSAAIILFFTSWRLLHDIEAGIQKMWSKNSPRPLVKRIFLSWLLILIFPLFLAIYVSFRSLDAIIPFFKANTPMIDFIVAILGLFLIYKIIPDAKVRNRAALSGALFAAIGIAALKASFTYLAKGAFSLNKIYGSLAAIPLLLFWILLLWYIVLFGVLVCSSVQKNTENPEFID
ncbi:MAG: YihY/virulence factor BrkB family protein [Bdellovibrionota bacterium]